MILKALEPDPGGSSRMSNRHRAYRRFQEELLSGRIRPGQNISQRELAAVLEMSLGALRELLPRLEAEGLLKVFSQRGMQIPVMDFRMIRDSYQLRMAYEREAASSAVEKLSDDVLDEQASLHLGILSRAENGIDAQLLEEAQAIDTGFHELLVHATDNDLLIQAYGVNAVRVRMINLDRIRLSPKVLAPALRDHMKVIVALRRRDRAEAILAMEHHIRNAHERAMSL